MVTIKDIAQRAGVSFSTVSKALLDSPLVKTGTKQHILAIAKEMGYQPNFAARSLVSRKSGVIGVVWPSIERAALSSLITNLNGELEKDGYTMLLSMSGIDSAIDTFRRFQVDAILVFGDKDKDANSPSFQPSPIPILTYGAANYTPFSAVDVNRGQAIRLAVRHLAELGHRNIAFIGEPETHDPLQAVKIESFRDEVIRLGLPFADDSILKMKGLAFHDGYLAAKTMLELQNKPTAVISGGIDLTSGILRAIAERGLRVPRDMSVVSYDNLPQMEDLDVPMTVVGVAISKITSVIAKTLLELIGEPDKLKTVHLEPELVVRSSSSAL
ncbi:LacI family transcriptional regulator [Cohnella endophytica]|uniref:LacI family transcriptional regulator n=1 Tax=Cohnella endophytica TaxID=2419778 RepID=A0A494Y650_9BACL|nr:LacI family DNA-binding transcriptional regulator [Cohnella endophytica]RKP58150.1 LacI family transcriptional regulator [Cohnella endophytica]